MNRQSIIYAVFAAFGSGLVAYCFALSATAWSRFGWSPTFALLASVVAALALLTGVFTWLAFLFRARAVSEISVVPGGVLLVPAGASFSVPVSASDIRVLRVIGAQFSHNEAEQAFTLFAAAGRVWVAPVHAMAATPERAQ